MEDCGNDLLGTNAGGFVVVDAGADFSGTNEGGLDDAELGWLDDDKVLLTSTMFGCVDVDFAGFKGVK